MILTFLPWSFYFSFYFSVCCFKTYSNPHPFRAYSILSLCAMFSPSFQSPLMVPHLPPFLSSFAVVHSFARSPTRSLWKGRPKFSNQHTQYLWSCVTTGCYQLLLLVSGLLYQTTDYSTERCTVVENTHSSPKRPE